MSDQEKYILHAVVLCVSICYSTKDFTMHSLGQGRPTRGPRARSGPPKVLKWPTKGFCVGWLINASALTL